MPEIRALGRLQQIFVFIVCRGQWRRRRRSNHHLGLPRGLWYTPGFIYSPLLIILKGQIIRWRYRSGCRWGQCEQSLEGLLSVRRPRWICPRVNSELVNGDWAKAASPVRERISFTLMDELSTRNQPKWKRILGLTRHSGFPSYGDEKFQISGHENIFSRFVLQGLAHGL